MPPSTTISVPVMKRASSEARNSAAFAVSRPSPAKPSGMRFRREFKSASTSPPARWSAGRRAADIVDQDVDASPGLYTVVHHTGSSTAVGDVANISLDNPLGLFDGLAQAPCIAVHGENLRAFLREAYRGGAAVAPARADRAGAGDDRNPILKSFQLN